MLPIILCVVLLSAFGTSVQAEDREIRGIVRGPGPVQVCHRPCAKIYAPVCAIPAENGILLPPKTFGNECELHNYNCDNQRQYKISYKGECRKPCNDVCPKIYEPVCAIPADIGLLLPPKTFSNKCELDNYNCANQRQFKISYKGECRKPCDDVCPTIYDPICAVPNPPCSGGGQKTFSSDCLLKVYNCHNPEQLYKQIHAGECKKSHN